MGAALEDAGYDVLNQVVLNQVHDEIMTNNISIDAGLAKMNEQVQKILAK